VGDKFHPKLSMSKIPIANKYREGKMKRTLKRELKVSEIAKREADKRTVPPDPFTLWTAFGDGGRRSEDCDRKNLASGLPHG
jgi:hypothetical protein